MVATGGFISAITQCRSNREIPWGRAHLELFTYATTSVYRLAPAEGFSPPGMIDDQTKTPCRLFLYASALLYKRNKTL
jgi:hypothetical protein